MRKAEDRKNIEKHVCVLHALQNAALVHYTLSGLPVWLSLN